MERNRKIAITGIFDDTPNYRNALTKLGIEWIVTASVDEALKCHGLLLPGGADVSPCLYGQEICGAEECNKELDDMQYAMIEAFISKGKPIMGICRGMQLLNVYFGGRLTQNIDSWDEHVIKNTVDQVHNTTIVPGTYLYPIYGAKAVVNSAHHQVVEKVGKGFIPAQYSHDNLLEGCYHQTLPIIGVQWHPERICFDKKREGVVDGSKVIDYFCRVMCSE